MTSYQVQIYKEAAYLYMTLIMICLFYTGIPVLIPIGFLNILSRYFSENRWPYRTLPVFLCYNLNHHPFDLPLNGRMDVDCPQRYLPYSPSLWKSLSTNYLYGPLQITRHAAISAFLHRHFFRSSMLMDNNQYGDQLLLFSL